MTSSTCSSEQLTGTTTMSGRGTITSRTTVSPNSKMEWIISRSSSSMTSSRSASSTMARSSSSETNGPVLRPLPGVMTLPMPISRRVSGPSTGSRVSHQTTGATVSADQPLHHRGEQRGGGELDHQHQQQDQVEGAGGLLHQLAQLAGAASALLLQVEGADPVGAGDGRLGHGQEGGHGGEQRHRDQGPDIAGGQLHRAASDRQRDSSSSVRARISRSSSGSAWSKPHRCRMPCTVSSSSSAARVWPARLACSAAYDGHRTMSPSSQGASSSSSSSSSSS